LVLERKSTQIFTRSRLSLAFPTIIIEAQKIPDFAKHAGFGLFAALKAFVFAGFIAPVKLSARGRASLWHDSANAVLEQYAQSCAGFEFHGLCLFVALVPEFGNGTLLLSYIAIFGHFVSKFG